METKTVALDLEAYTLLKKAKRQGESFSDAVKHLAGKPTSWLELAGSWSDVPESALKVQREERRKAERDRDARLRRGMR
jgi:predicted CopG family antitoxin